MVQRDGGNRLAGSARAMSEDVDQSNLFTIALDWRRWWTVIPEIVVLCCTGALPVVVMANVLARYTDWFHVFWAEDVVKVLFLWIVFLGGAIAVKYDAHVRMSNLSDRLVKFGRTGALWGVVIRLSPIVVGAILLVLGMRVVEISMRRELPSLGISAGYFSTIVPASGALMIAYVVNGLRARRGRKPDARPDQGA
jgi:TRAP-type C4-dicarboxylate transport system permease small subunit